MSINILVFAKLADELGIGQDCLDFVAKETVEEAFARLTEKHSTARCGQPLSQEGVRVAVNERFVSWTTIVNDGDEVAFIPPVAGG